MNTKQLPYILAIESTGNLSNAAKELGISQPALSKYLTELEAELGLELFVRVKKQMVPTAAGKLYLETARNILRISAQTYDSIKRLHYRDYKDLQVGVSPYRGGLFLAKVYPELMQFYPNCRLKPVEGYALDLKEKVLSGEISLAITSYCGERHPDLDVFVASREEIVLAVPSFYPIAKHSTELSFDELPFADLNEFEKYSFIMPDQKSALYYAIKPAVDELSFKPLVAFSCSNVIMQKALIESGAGIGLLPSYHAKPNDKLVFFRPLQKMYMPGCIIKRKDHEFSEAEKFLIYLHIISNVNSSYKTNTTLNQELLEICEEAELVRKQNITGGGTL